jgi:hypothetical protein
LKISNFYEFCKDKDFEACAILLELSYTKILVMTMHRSPSGDFQIFLNRLKVIIKKFFQSDLKSIICGVINVSYLTDTDSKRQLDSVLNCYNLFSMMHSPTRNQNESSIAIGHIFIDTFAFSKFKIIPIINPPYSHPIFAPLQFRNQKRLFMGRQILGGGANVPPPSQVTPMNMSI